MRRLVRCVPPARHGKDGKGTRPRHHHCHDRRATKPCVGLLQLTESQVKNPAAQVTLSLQHTFGKRQELQQVQRNDTVGGITRSKDSRYSFDDELRLTQVQTDIGGVGGTDTETFTLDALANRTAHNKYPGAWQFDANNRLTQRGSGACAAAGTVCYAYDEAGNLQTKTEGAKLTRYAYDTLNRLVEVKDGSDQLIARYGYDPMSRRLWKEQYRDLDGNPLAAPKRTTYLYADEGLIAEARQVITLNADGSVSASAAPVVTTQYGPRPDAPFTTGMLFIKTQNSKGQDTLAYYHHDHLGTPIQATDKTGRVVWAADYNAFGLASIITPAATEEAPTIGSNLRLPGQYWDEESGLHYNWHRYYDGATGRYVQSDPIGLRGGLNTYAYVGGNPLLYVDPMGLWITATYDHKAGNLYVYDDATGTMTTGSFESGGKRWGAPIPNGDYDLLGHPDRDFFRLEPVDSSYGDDADSRTNRDKFRLHKPGRTQGCIAATDRSNWEQIRDLIRNTKTRDQVPVNSKSRNPFSPRTETLPRYGRLTVVNSN